MSQMRMHVIYNLVEAYTHNVGILAYQNPFNTFVRHFLKTTDMNG